jgi:hypothetical protein
LGGVIFTKRIFCIGLLTVLSACAVPPPSPPPDPVLTENYPLLDGVSSPDTPAPPPLAQNLVGVGNVQLGMPAYDAAHLGYSYESDNDGTYLAGLAVIDGIQTLERLNTSGTPPQVSSIVFEVQTVKDQNGNNNCPSPQPIFDDLLQKYGPEKTTRDSSKMAAYTGQLDENLYTWTFNGGRTIVLDDEPWDCASISYNEAEAPENTPSL